jgi:uncharacterized repeat protein (TIGR03803 family)
MNERKVSLSRLVQWIGLAAANFVIVGALAAGVFLFGWAKFARALPELQGWHRQAPASEFRAADVRPGYTFDNYLKQETEVFKQLHRLVAGPWTAEAVGRFDRFRAGSRCNPENTLDRNWNRSFVLKAVVQANDGSFYGTTPNGGANGFGTVFRLSVPPSSLNIALSGSTVVLSWPSWASDLNLQQTPDLTDRNWAAVTNSPVVVNLQNQVTLAPQSGGTRFYRLTH